MRQYETMFIVDPVLSGDEIKQTAQLYSDHLKSAGCEIVHVEEMGIKQLAYPIAKRSSGAYFCVEYKTDKPQVIEELELAFRRDDHVIRYLTLKLDKHGIQYNIDKRAGKFDKKEEKEEEAKEEAKS